LRAKPPYAPRQTSDGDGGYDYIVSWLNILEGSLSTNEISPLSVVFVHGPEDANLGESLLRQDGEETPLARQFARVQYILHPVPAQPNENISEISINDQSLRLLNSLEQYRSSVLRTSGEKAVS